MRSLLGLSLLITAGLTSPCSAQTLQDPWEQMRFRAGALAWTPTINIKNVGVDTNVFNSAENPRQDFTITAGPRIDWWLRAGDARIHGTNGADAVYFSTYETERSINQSHELTLEYRLNRIQPYLSGSFRTTNDRPGYEIDARARHNETDLRGGAIVTLTGKTRIDVAGFQRQYQFTGDDVFLGTHLADTLNRKSTGGNATVSFAVTPLTTISLLAEARKEMFSGESIRDNRSFSLLPGVAFSPDALLQGTARIGYRRLDMADASIPDFQGLVAAANISYVLMGRTKFTVAADRDAQFSYETIRPYYVLTGIGATARQSLARGFDLEARVSEQRLAYRHATFATESTSRVDNVSILGGGLGYTTSQDTRVALDADYVRRRTLATGRNYEGLRAGLSVAYGF